MRKKRNPKFHVSRQIQWPDGTKVVEVVSGGFEYSNPGALVPKWRSLGEDKEFDDPREAVAAAIAICLKWREADADPGIEIGYGSTGGSTMPLSPAEFADAQAWADKRAESLAKCDHCGELLSSEVFTHDFADFGEEFCSNYCAELDYHHRTQDSEETEGDTP